jgi:hypothetical protein
MTPPPDDHERTLDEEGIPDLEGPLPGKAITGDPQEGLPPPNEKPRAATDWGVTAAEQREGESIARRVEREQPDVDEAPSASVREAVVPVEPQGTRGNGGFADRSRRSPSLRGRPDETDDTEKDEVADEARAEGAPSPEEAALHVERR